MLSLLHRTLWWPGLHPPGSLREETDGKDEQDRERGDREGQILAVPQACEPVPELGREDVRLSPVELQVVNVSLRFQRVIAQRILRFGARREEDRDRGAEPGDQNRNREAPQPDSRS
jgi:hypothetical protein